jgi:hypothetical protein
MRFSAEAAMKPKQFTCRFTHQELSDIEEFLQFIHDAKLTDHPRFWPVFSREELFNRFPKLTLC